MYNISKGDMCGDEVRKIEIVELYDYPYRVQVLNALRQYCGRFNSFNCVGTPKRCHMLLRPFGCKAIYTMKDGRVVHAKEGDIVYIPQGAEYEVVFYDFVASVSHTIHINFLLYDEDGRPFTFDESIAIWRADNVDYAAIFEEIDRFSEANVQCHGKIKAIMYDLLFRLSEYYHVGYRNTYALIARGISYLEREEQQNFKISEIADMCNVSEVYFRKLFKEYAGKSPTQYRTDAKMRRAKVYLEQDALSVYEISERLGFSDVSYFIKVFREYVGTTPKAYRERNREEDVR